MTAYVSEDYYGVDAVVLHYVPDGAAVARVPGRKNN